MKVCPLKFKGILKPIKQKMYWTKIKLSGDLKNTEEMEAGNASKTHGLSSSYTPIRSNPQKQKF